VGELPKSSFQRVGLFSFLWPIDSTKEAFTGKRKKMVIFLFLCYRVCQPLRTKSTQGLGNNGRHFKNTVKRSKTHPIVSIETTFK
jgi:hypothetical protein